MGKLNKPRGRVGAGFTRTESTKTVDGRKLLGNVELSRAITRAGVPRGVAVASIARLPSSTDDPPSSGSTADRHFRVRAARSRVMAVFRIHSSSPLSSVGKRLEMSATKRARSLGQLSAMRMSST